MLFFREIDTSVLFISPPSYECSPLHFPHELIRANLRPSLYVDTLHRLRGVVQCWQIWVQILTLPCS